MSRRFEVVIDDEDRAEAPDMPWTVSLFEMTSGLSGDLIYATAGSTVGEALAALAEMAGELLEDSEGKR